MVREQAHKEADQLRSDTLAALEGEIRELAIGLTERILTQACTVSLNEQLAHRLIETIRAVTGDELERVRRDTGTGAAVVESAAMLDDAIRADLTAAVHELLGHPCQVTFEQRSALIGGARLRAGGHVWDATVAAQLDAARSATAGGP